MSRWIFRKIFLQERKYFFFGKTASQIFITKKKPKENRTETTIKKLNSISSLNFQFKSP